MMGKYEIGAQSQKKLLECTNENNRNYLNQYIYYRNKRKEPVRSTGNYVSTIVGLYEFLGNKNVQSMDAEDMKEFLVNKYPNIRTLNTRIDYLKNFLEFLEANSSLNITVNQLQGLKGIVNKEETRSGIPLSFNEIIKLRKILKNEEKYEWWLTFELIYNFGLKYSQLTSISKSSYDSGKGVIKIESKSFYVNSLIKYLIEEENALPDKNSTIHVYQYAISRIAERVNKELIWKDIVKTRKSNFLRCPVCRDLFENTPDNWAIYHYQIDDSKWILCRSCAGGKRQ